jgi:hypothetical protein
VIHRIGRQYEQAAQDLASRLDHQAERLAQAPLIAQLQEGEHIELRLVAPDLDIEMPAQEIVWRGGEQVVAFIARITKPGLTQALARLQVLCEGVPIGYAVFRVSCAPVEPATAKSGTNSETSFGGMSYAPANRPMRLVRYSRAFLSYSSNDRLHVLRHHQLLKLLGIEIFQDMVSLQPGEAWSETLLKKIDTADLILVYWSSSAASSEWVCKEVEYALSLRDKRGNDVPDIVPVILEGPPVPRPPQSIARVHFNDPMRYIIYAHEEATR